MIFYWKCMVTVGKGRYILHSQNNETKNYFVSRIRRDYINRNIINEIYRLYLTVLECWVSLSWNLRRYILTTKSVNMDEEVILIEVDVEQTPRIFGNRSHDKFTIVEKYELAQEVKTCKEAYDAEIKLMKVKTHYDQKRKRHVQLTPKYEYLAKALRNFYSNLKHAKSDSPEFRNASKVAKRSYKKLLNGDFVEEEIKKTKFRTAGGGRKLKVPDVRSELFAWFVDVRTSLRGTFTTSDV